LGTGFNNTVQSISLQKGEKFIVGGSFTSFNGTTANRIVRLDYNFTKDSSFNTGAGAGQGFNGAVSFISPEIDDNGRIIVGGSFTFYRGTTANRIIRLNSDGSVDSSFNSGTGFGNGEVRSVSLQTDGKIIVGGSFTTYKDIESMFIIRLNTDGSESY
jgi:hypothetical protein